MPALPNGGIVLGLDDKGMSGWAAPFVGSGECSCAVPDRSPRRLDAGRSDLTARPESTPWAAASVGIAKGGRVCVHFGRM